MILNANNIYSTGGDSSSGDSRLIEAAKIISKGTTRPSYFKSIGSGTIGNEGGNGIFMSAYINPLYSSSTVDNKLLITIDGKKYKLGSDRNGTGSALIVNEDFLINCDNSYISYIGYKNVESGSSIGLTYHTNCTGLYYVDENTTGIIDGHVIIFKSSLCKYSSSISIETNSTGVNIEAAMAFLRLS